MGVSTQAASPLSRPPSAGVSRSNDRLEDHPPIRDERHDEAQHASHNNGPHLVVLDVHPDEHEALDRQNCGGHHRECRQPAEGGGTISPTTQTSSRMPRAIQASCGNAPKDGTCPLILSNIKTFMKPDAPYMSAAKTCRTHNRMFIVCLLLTSGWLPQLDRVSLKIDDPGKIAVLGIIDPALSRPAFAWPLQDRSGSHWVGIGRPVDPQLQQHQADCQHRRANEYADEAECNHAAEYAEHNHQ